MEKHISLDPSSISVLNSATHKCWTLVSTLGAFLMCRTCPQFGKNANVRRTPMSKKQVKFICDLWYDFMLKIKIKRETPSLLAEGIIWCNNVQWIPRLVAFGQLDCWLSYKHTNED